MDIIERIKNMQMEFGQVAKEKRPREYAEHILTLRKREDRAKALSEVPEHLQDMVKKHVESHFMRMKNK